jgi:hypothetical protein
MAKPQPDFLTHWKDSFQLGTGFMKGKL